ncbi:MAG TPA: ATP-dependent zinc metalloprotease FtsH [Alphaproteobacteria bacterium]
MNPIWRNIFAWLMIALVIGGLYQMMSPNAGMMNAQTIPYSEFLSQAAQGSVGKVTLQGNLISGTYKEGNNFRTLKPEGSDVADRLIQNGVTVEVKPVEGGMSGLFGVLLSWFPMLLLIGVWIFFMRQMQGKGGGGAMGFGRSRAKLLTEKTNKVMFEDVAGVEEAKDELQEIVEFLKDPQKFQRLGGKIPKGALLIGPPGTGKTLIARAVAGEAGVPFFTISGSDFVEMFVGVGASRVRDMFEQAKKSAPCIIFIDEIDAVGRHRGAGLGGGNDEREQTLNQLLVEMDGFESSEGVILIAATNRPDVLDPALLRPGRFDRQVVVPNPDITGREKILKVHMKKVPLDHDVNAKTLARGTPGFSGADLANLVNEAALLAARQGKKTVDMQCFEQAKDKVMMGAERRSLVMSDEEKKLTAYHEAGHAVVAIHEPSSDPIHKATIIPRGRALGMVMRLPEGDRVSLSRAKLHADLAVAMGGRVAEEMIFGYDKVTTGASSDIQMATNIAQRMVSEWGMSDKLGTIRYSPGESEEVFLGHSVTKTKNLSDNTAQMVDEEIRAIVDKAYQRARTVLTEHENQLVQLAQALLEYETLSGEEIKILFDGGTIERPDANGGQTVIKLKPTSSVPRSKPAA